MFEELGLAYAKGMGKSPEFAGDYGLRDTTKFDVGTISEDIPNIGVIRGERQSMKQAGSFANQAVVGEVIGGTVMGPGCYSRDTSTSYRWIN